ncbi:sugar phosphate isomerase/epimerase family protein [Nocardioides marinquilinus]
MLGTGAAGAVGVAGAGLVGAGASASPAQAAPGKRKIDPRHISIQLYTLSALTATDLDGTLEALAEIGFTRVEHAGIPEGMTARQFRAALNRHGLRSTSGHNTPPSDPLNRNAWRRVLDDANTLGQKTVNWSAPGLKGFDPVTGPVFIETKDEWLRLAELVNEAGLMAHRNGLKFGLHNHFWEFAPVEGTPLTGSDILFAETDPRYVNFEIDIYWAWYGHNDPARIVALEQDRVTQFHVKDMSLVSPPSDQGEYTFTDPGAGIIDFARIFAAKKDTAQTEFIIERDDAGTDALRTARRGFRFLRNLRW